MDDEVFRRVNPRDYLRRFLAKDIRPDGRAPNMARKINITAGSINTAVGSAMVKLGRTTAVAGVHATLVEPSPSSPGDGILDVVVEMLPIVTISGGNRGTRAVDDAVALSHYLRNWIVPHVQLADLCVEKAQLVWRLRLTVYCIDNDGNLEDAVVLAAVAAIGNVKLPSVTLLEGDEGTDVGADDSAMTDDDAEKIRESSSVVAMASEERNTLLQAEGLPVTVSFSLFDGKALLDPSGEEEAVADSRLTMVFRPTGELRGVDKGGGKNISEDLLASCMRLAQERVDLLVNKLNER